MISDVIRALILKKDENYTVCYLASHLLIDDDLVELAELVSQNPYITCIDLENNPEITTTGATRLMKSLPNVKIINCSCFLTIEEIMEQSTQIRRIPRVPVGAVFIKSASTIMSRSIESEQLAPLPQSSETIYKY